MPKSEPRIRWEELQGRRTVHSPLRYPGGKRRLVPYVAAALEANGLKPDLFVEPFAGGASVALELAASGAVEKIGIADVDPYIAAFWKTACGKNPRADGVLRPGVPHAVQRGCEQPEPPA